ncbi:MAG: phosphoribosyltransferase [Methylacidiphilales bacterium]|nr:phosphoribosyltransferase [Candidatus Methylacidiphilales bacterium]
MYALFQNREDAGRQLAEKFVRYANRKDVVVLALPRGGVPVGYEVARKLHAPLALIIVRKLGVPGQDELAMGAIAPGDIQVINAEVVQKLQISDETIQAVAAAEKKELIRQEQLYHDHSPPVGIQGQKIILVDDGIATGSTMQAAVRVLKQQQSDRVMIAVPVASPEAYDLFFRLVDEIVVLAAPSFFQSVGQAYEDFSPTTDAEVNHLLDSARTACT